MMKNGEMRDTQEIDTDGEEYIRGDKIIHGDQVHGDKIATGAISDSNVVIGRGGQLKVNTGLGGDEIARLFDGIYQEIETRPEDPDVDKEELTQTVQKIQNEVIKGEAANPKKVERWLDNLVGMAKDIFDVTVACLISPAAGLAEVIKKVAEKAKADAG